MSWFKGKDPNAIPSVNERARSELLGTGDASRGGRAASAPPSASPYTSRTATDPYARPTPARYNNQESNIGGLPAGPAPARDRYNRNNPVGDAYSRGRANTEQDRAELFAGYDPVKHQSSSGAPSTGGDDGEDEVEGIKKQSSFIKQESINSTRNALRIAREAEETARNPLVATVSDDEMEDELDENLGEISDVVKRLKALSTVMGREVDNQNVLLCPGMGEKAEKLDNKLIRGTERFKKIK